MVAESERVSTAPTKPPKRHAMWGMTFKSSLFNPFYSFSELPNNRAINTRN